MTEEREFYLTTYTVEVLSEDPIPLSMDLRDVLRECNEGMYVGEWDDDGEPQKIDAATCRDKLIAFRSDPDFFMLDEEGE